MKSLIKKLSNTSIGIYLRNSLNISPVHMSINKLKYISVSDAFAWRTDSNFITKFKYSDILNIFYKIHNSWVEIHFYSKDYKLIKIKKINNLEISNCHQFKFNLMIMFYKMEIIYFHLTLKSLNLKSNT
jgi:hypothetical protein